MDLKTYLRAERGRAARLAEYLGLSAVTVGEWAAQKKAVDARWASLIEGWSAGHVTRECLRPTDWWVIWPELRSRSQAPAGIAVANSNQPARSQALISQRTAAPTGVPIP